MPILVLSGECSFGIAALDSMHLLATDVRGGVIPDSGHWIPKDQPDFIIEQFVNFFGNGTKATE